MIDTFQFLAKIVVGNHELENVWVGLIASAISGILMLRIYFGKDFAYHIKLADILYWFLGVFIVMRSSMFLLSQIPVLKSIKSESLDSTIMGFIAGVINVYLFKNNYQPITKYLDKIFKNDSSLKKIITHKEEINTILSDIVKMFDGKGHAFVFEVVNGGADLKVDTPMFFKPIFGTDYDILEIFGDKKTICTESMVKSFRQILIDGNSIRKPFKDKISFYQDWIEINEIDKVANFIIGYEKKRVLILQVFLKKEVVVEDSKNIKIISYSKKIKKIINNSRKFFESKLS